MSRVASPAEIRRAFRRLALRHHPDRCPGDPGATARMRRINEAYDALRDPARRAAADAELAKRQADDATQRLMDALRRSRTRPRPSQDARPTPPIPSMSRQPFTWLASEIAKSRPRDEAFWWVIVGAALDASRDS